MSILPISEEIQVKKCTEAPWKNHCIDIGYIDIECFIESNPTGQSLSPYVFHSATEVP